MWFYTTYYRHVKHLDNRTIDVIYFQQQLFYLDNVGHFHIKLKLNTKGSMLVNKHPCSNLLVKIVSESLN